jgi:hypothetical protein
VFECNKNQKTVACAFRILDLKYFYSSVGYVYVFYTLLPMLKICYASTIKKKNLRVMCGAYETEIYEN